VGSNSVALRLTLDHRIGHPHWCRSCSTIPLLPIGHRPEQSFTGGRSPPAGWLVGYAGGTWSGGPDTRPTVPGRRAWLSALGRQWVPPNGDKGADSPRASSEPGSASGIFGSTKAAGPNGPARFRRPDVRNCLRSRHRPGTLEAIPELWMCGIARCRVQLGIGDRISRHDTHLFVANGGTAGARRS
jgi:hypothetical protein